MTKTDKAMEVLNRSKQLANEMHDASRRRVDRLFVWLMLVQWIAGVCTAAWVSPNTWIGSQSLIHEHIWASILIGGLLTAAPCYLGIYHPGRTVTRHVVAISQALWGVLLIHLSGGRIETHFHVFGSLAFIAFYRDWKVLVTMTAVVGADHAIRGIFFPLSVYGVLQESPFRWLEHVGWVLCENVVLFSSCRRGSAEVQQISLAQAELEVTNRQVEETVSARTSELSDATEFFRSVLDSIDADVCVLDQDGMILEANHSWQKAHENSPEVTSTVGDSYIDNCQSLADQGVPGADEVVESIYSVLEKRSHCLVPEFAFIDEGDTKWCQVNISPVLGHQRGAAVVARINITERVVAERDLKTASEHLERMSLIAKHTDNAVLIMKPDGRVELVNEGFERLYGYAADEIIGRRPHDLLLGEESDADTVSYVNEKLSCGSGYDVELCKYKKNGEPVWVSIEVRPIFNPDGTLRRFISLARDITQAREREQSLQLLREAIDNANDAMFIIQSDGCIIDVNITAGRMLGYSRRELLQLSMMDIERGFTSDSMVKRWLADQQSDMGGTFTTKAGESFPVEVSTVPVSYRGKAYFCAFAQDISERKIAEAEHDRLNFELRNAARQTGMAEVAADVLHNVGNALNSINVSVQSLQQLANSKSPDLLARVAQTICDKREDDLGDFFVSNKQGRMFPDMLQQLGLQFQKERTRQTDEIHELLSKLEHVKEVVASQKAFSHRRSISEAVTPAGVFHEAIRMHSYSAGQAGVHVEEDFADIDEIFLEKHFVMQILINLIKNARESVCESGVEAPCVKLETRLENDCICFQVTDNGVGVAEANLVEIFQHGFTTKKTGHGFGLHSCANLAQEMGGTLTVKSDGIGCGATFVLKLPVQRTATVEAAS